MRINLLFSLINCVVFWVSGVSVSAQLSPGFNKEEARDMLALCNSFTFMELYGDDSPVIPPGYEKIYNSEAIGLDNMYQLYRRGDIAVICFRGSTAKKLSWLANFNASMIPAEGKIKDDPGDISYCFAKEDGATVHGGFALAIAYMAEDLRRELFKLTELGIKDLLITGHSQGGALANLTMALLENHKNDTANVKIRFKTYAIAAPMVGDELFSEEYNKRYAQKGFSFNLVNSNDPIPKLPGKSDEYISIFTYLRSLSPKYETIPLKGVVKKRFYKELRNYATHEVLSISGSIKREIKRDLGEDLKFPKPTNNFNYANLENRIELSLFETPKVLKDSSKLQRKFQYNWFTNGKDSKFKNKHFYVKTGKGWQHKSYNYYVGFLKEYFEQDYLLLDLKYLPENL